MNRIRFPLAVALTSLGIVAALFLAGGLLVGSVFAFGPWHGGPAGAPWTTGVGQWGGPHNGSMNLPTELTGLADVSPADRFAHFKGVQVSLTDKDGQPLAITVTPGTAAAMSDSSLTIAANDGSTRTFVLDSSTMIRSRGVGAADAARIAQNDQVVVVTLNGSSTAMAVLSSTGAGPWNAFAH